MARKRSSTLRDRHRRIIARGQPPCAICNQPIDYTIPYPDPDSFVVDHKTPFAHGGKDTLDNKQPAHNRCNRIKSDRPEPEVPKLRRHYTKRTW
nr:HNH endonuclease signature motif containing protein [Gordonia paraffinivorans]